MAQATARATFDELFVSGGPLASDEPVRQPRWWTSVEAWITFALILTAQFPVIGSLQSANWVTEMPSLGLTALAGIVVGWLLAQSSWRGSLATLAGAVAAAAGPIPPVVQR